MKVDLYDRLRRVNLNQLLAFVVVAECASFRQAAARMHLSQSAVSVQVRELERSLGVPLFSRTTRSVALADAGHELLPVAKRLCQDIGEITSRFHEEAQLHSGTVTVVALPSMSVGLMPRLMRAFQDRYQDVELNLLDVDSKTAREVLREGDADFGVLSQSPDMSGFDFEPLYAEDLVLVSPQSTAPKTKGPVMVQDLEGIPLLLAPQGVHIRTVVDEWFSRAGVVPDIRQQCIRPETLLALVREGFGSTIAVAGSLRPDERSAFVVHALRPCVARHIGLVTRHAAPMRPAAQAFWSFIRGQAARATTDSAIAASTC